MKEKFKLTALEKYWVLYDIGNSAFILLATALFPIYFGSLTDAAGISETNQLAYWGYAGSISTILVAIMAPICGAMADRGKLKKPLFLAFMLLGCLGCAALGAPAGWLGFLIVYVISKVEASPAVWYSTIPCSLRSPPKSAWIWCPPWAMPWATSALSSPLSPAW